MKALDAGHAPFGLPVAKGATKPICEATHFCPQIHGMDALGDLQPPIPPSK